MTTKMRFLAVAILMAAVLVGSALTVKADPTPCVVGCYDPNSPVR